MVQNIVAFTPQGMKGRMLRTDLQSAAFDPEGEAVFVMAKASECASSDSCSIEEAEFLLKEVIHLQSGCAVGNIKNYDICENIAIPNEIVAGLRHKIETSAKTPANALNIKSMMSPVFVSMFTIYMLSSIAAINHQPGVDTFTSQEIWWAVRDGYLGDLISQFVKNGGLSSIDVSSSAGVPFTGEEWMWSIRDNYFDTMTTDFLKSGGL